MMMMMSLSKSRRGAFQLPVLARAGRAGHTARRAPGLAPGGGAGGAGRARRGGGATSRATEKPSVFFCGAYIRGFVEGREYAERCRDRDSGCEGVRFWAWSTRARTAAAGLLFSRHAEPWLSRGEGVCQQRRDQRPPLISSRRFYSSRGELGVMFYCCERTKSARKTSSSGRDQRPHTPQQ